MCGIVGYIGKEKEAKDLISCLQQLDYRGYDSCGITTTNGGPTTTSKVLGGPEKLTSDDPMIAGIAHTRWATHGKVTIKNTHPQCVDSTIFVVHNGIIENYSELKKQLTESLDCKFNSETDTEVIAHVFKQYIEQPNSDNLTSIRCTMEKLTGKYAFLILHKNNIFFVKNGCSLNLYSGPDGIYLSSSDLTGIDVNQKCILPDKSYGVINYRLGLYPFVYISKQAEWKSYNPNKVEAMPSETNDAKLGKISYMEKEILEQKLVIKNTINNFPSHLVYERLENIDYIRIIGCGSSYNAGLVGKYLFQDVGMPCSVELSSEFYPVVPKNTLLIYISQSGETADTLSAMKEATRNGIYNILSICNNESEMSTLSNTIFTNVGIEKGVASTKTFSSQVAVLYMISLIIAKRKQMDIQDCVDKIPQSLEARNISEIEIHAEHNLQFKKTAFMGGGIYYPLALEAALKFKELTYIPAQGYAGGEFKHGPISLADKDLIVYSIGNDMNSTKELTSREAEAVYIPSGYDEEILRFFEKLVQLQLLAMFTSSKMGYNVDRPRNLAKSVTVE